jgi:poly-gamma-glutamate synthesis protein (capsule biosynthesis protein)
VKLFLCGDVMTGRGIDQALAHSCAPEIDEPWVRSALDYVRLAEERNGRIPRPVPPDWIWGDALAVLDEAAPAARIVNLETAVTLSEDREPKGINYRMHPANVGVLACARVDCCALANNHVLDWGAKGLEETLDTLHAAGIATAGAGRNEEEAIVPAALPLAGGGRLLVFSCAMASSGVPEEWAATGRRPGVHFLPDGSSRTVRALAGRVAEHRRAGDLALLSLHWGGNWGYGVSAAERRFAHAVLDEAGIDLLHGHSSHHPRGIEVHGGKAVLYGCGDLINDYEGISGHEEYRGDLGLLYFPVLEPASGRLAALEMAATAMKRFGLRRAAEADADWLAEMLTREGRRWGTSARRSRDRIRLDWTESVQPQFRS